MTDKLSKEGKWTVLRDSKGEIITKVVSRATERENWRSIMKKLTDGGQMPIRTVVALAEGEARTVKLADGSESEPIIPNDSIRLEAAKWLHEQMYGKAVTQTEIVKAEAETRLQAQVQALSNEELHAKVFAEMGRRGITAGNVVNSSDPDSSDPADTEPGAK